jgi:hypothetical protein
MALQKEQKSPREIHKCVSIGAIDWHKRFMRRAAQRKTVIHSIFSRARVFLVFEKHGVVWCDAKSR